MLDFGRDTVAGLVFGQPPDYPPMYPLVSMKNFGSRLAKLGKFLQ